MTITQKINVFFKEVWVEMRRVNWLSKQEIVNYTLIVLAVTAVVSVFLGALDYIFSEVIKQFLLK